MKLLMLVAYPTIRSPIPKITPQLVAALQQQGVAVDTEYWGRHHDGESRLAKVSGRLSDAWRVRKRLLRGKYDVMVVHTSHDLKGAARDLPMFLAARAVVPRIVIHFHGSRPEILLGPGNWLFKLVARATMGLADGGLLLSTEDRDRWRRLYPAKQFHLIANPFVGPGGDRPNLPPRRANDDVPTLLYVGRIMEAKGVMDLLEAFGSVLKQRQCRLIFAGTGPDEKRLTERIASLGLAAAVTVAGHVTGDALSSLYHQATVFVLPTWYAEGFPTVISEAMDAGLPMITTRAGGTADHLRDGINVSFVPPRDAPALSAAILKLIDNPTEQLAMGRANQIKVRDFSPDVIGPAYLAALRDFVGKPKPLAAGAR